MANSLPNLYEGLRAYFATTLGVPVKLGFRDERAENEDARAYPCATLIMYDAMIAYGRRYGGVTRVISPHPEHPSSMALVSDLPTPVDIYFQLDTYAVKRFDDWTMFENIIRTLARHQGFAKVLIPDETPVHLIPTVFTPLDQIEQNTWRKDYRFKVETWYENAASAQDAYLVLTRHLQGNDSEQYAMDA